MPTSFCSHSNTRQVLPVTSKVAMLIFYVGPYQNSVVPQHGKSHYGLRGLRALSTSGHCI